LSDLGPRVVAAVHGAKRPITEPPFVQPLVEWLREHYSYDRMVDLYARFVQGDDPMSTEMRAAIFAAAARRAGLGLKVGSGVGFKHLDTFEIGDGVFIGAQSYLQGRFDGLCAIGARTWIGPQSYFDARNLIIEEQVGWGPGAKVLGSTHTALPINVPIIQTDLEIKPVRIEAWADVGTGAVILPGVTVGRGSIIGAGAVVTQDVPPFSIAAGVPARVLRSRKTTRHSAEEQALLGWTR
jgi:acetyltransferase-like isoleucine patch superfamily enzyme